MKTSKQDEAEGKFHKAKGKLKQIAGLVTNDPKLESEGITEKVTGKLQEKLGQIKKVFEG